MNRCGFLMIGGSLLDANKLGWLLCVVITIFITSHFFVKWRRYGVVHVGRDGVGYSNICMPQLIRFHGYRHSSSAARIIYEQFLF